LDLAWDGITMHLISARALRKAPECTVLLSAVIAWVVWGVGFRDVVVFLAFEATFVVLPGWAAFRALTGRPVGALREIAFGTALGHVLLVLAALGAAKVGNRELFLAYPALVVLGSIPRLRRKELRKRTRVLGLRQRWVATAITVLTLLYVGFGYFTQTPLPWSVASVSYAPDVVFGVSLAAEAKHHLPMQDPQLAGLSLGYENFVYVLIGQTSRTTGIPVATLLFRLVPFEMLVAAALAIAAAAERFARRAWTIPLSLALFFLVGEIDLSPVGDFPFQFSFFYGLWTAPTFLFGLVVLPMALVLGFEQAVVDPSRRRRFGPWVVLGLAAIGCAGGKGAALPVVIAASAFFTAVQAVRRTAFLRAAAVTALLTAILVLFVEFQFQGRTGGVGLSALGTIKSMAPLAIAAGRVPHGVMRALFWAAAVVVGSLGCFGAPLVGLFNFVRSRSALNSEYIWLAGALLSGFAAFYLLHAQGNTHLAALAFALVAGAILSAEGLQRLSWPSIRHSTALVALWLALLITLSLVVWRLNGHVLNGRAYALWYGGLALLLICLGGWAWRSSGVTVAAALSGALILVGALDAPLDWIAPIASDRLAARGFYVPDDAYYNRGLTSSLYQGLVWIRDRSSVDAVLAVNNHYLHGGGGGPQYFYYSAFAERRVFLEAWLYSPRTIDSNFEAVNEGRIQPYPGRFALNEAVFRRGDSRALCAMARRYGVDYLVYDHEHAHSHAPPPALTTRVFANPGVAIYAVHASRCAAARRG
jgi:hypothetical protein